MADLSRIGVAIDRKMLRPSDGVVPIVGPFPDFALRSLPLSHPLRPGDRLRTERMTAKSKLLEETMAIESGRTR